jgi:putative oxidoreductase
MKRHVQTAGCWLLAAVFGWAGAIKALDPAALAEAVQDFRLVPWPVGVGLALYLPWLELAVAVALVVGRWREGALWICAGLSGVFAVVWAVTWARGLDVACGCFGAAGATSAGWAFLRAGVLTGLAGWLARAAGGSVGKS